MYTPAHARARAHTALYLELKHDFRCVLYLQKKRNMNYKSVIENRLYDITG